MFRLGWCLSLSVHPCCTAWLGWRLDPFIIVTKSSAARDTGNGAGCRAGSRSPEGPDGLVVVPCGCALVEGVCGATGLTGGLKAGMTGPTRLVAEAGSIGVGLGHEAGSLEQEQEHGRPRQPTALGPVTQAAERAGLTRAHLAEAF